MNFKVVGVKFLFLWDLLQNEELRCPSSHLCWTSEKAVPSRLGSIHRILTDHRYLPGAHTSMNVKWAFPTVTSIPSKVSQGQGLVNDLIQQVYCGWTNSSNKNEITTPWKVLSTEVTKKTQRRVLLNVMSHIFLLGRCFFVNLLQVWPEIPHEGERPDKSNIAWDLEGFDAMRDRLWTFSRYWT